MLTKFVKTVLATGGVLAEGVSFQRLWSLDSPQKWLEKCMGELPPWCSVMGGWEHSPVQSSIWNVSGEEFHTGRGSMVRGGGKTVLELLRGVLFSKPSGCPLQNSTDCWNTWQPARTFRRRKFWSSHTLCKTPRAQEFSNSSGLLFLCCHLGPTLSHTLMRTVSPGKC